MNEHENMEVQKFIEYHPMKAAPQTLKEYMNQKKARKLRRAARTPLRQRIRALIRDMHDAGIQFKYMNPMLMHSKQLSGYNGYLRQVIRGALS